RRGRALALRAGPAAGTATLGCMAGWPARQDRRRRRPSRSHDRRCSERCREAGPRRDRRRLPARLPGLPASRHRLADRPRRAGGLVRALRRTGLDEGDGAGGLNRSLPFLHVGILPMPIGDFPDRRYLIDARELGERLGTLTLIDLRPAEDFSLGHIEGSRHLDIYGVSLSDSSDAPLDAFLSMFR